MNVETEAYNRAMINLKALDNLMSFYGSDYKKKMKELNYYYNRQFTKEEAKDIKQKTNVDAYPINVLRTTVEQEVSILTSDRPIFKTVPVNGADKSAGYMFHFLLNHWGNSNRWNEKLEGAIKNSLITGIHWFRISSSIVEEEHLFNIRIEDVPFYKVFPDIRIQSPTFSDMAGLVYYDYIPMSTAKRLSGKAESELGYGVSGDYVVGEPIRQHYNKMFLSSEALQFNHFVDSPESDPLVLYIERHYKVDQEVYKVFSMDYNVRTSLHLPLFLSLSEVKTLMNTYPDLAELVNSGVVVVKKTTRPIWKVAKSYGYYGVEAISTQLTMCNYIPIVNEMGGSVENIFGEVHWLMPLQDAINKFVKLSLVNAMLTAMSRVYYEEGSVDPDKMMKWLSGDTQALPVKRTSASDTKLPIDIIPGRPIETGFYTMYQDLFSKMEYFTGLYSVILGDAQNSPDVFSSIAALENFGTQRLKKKARQISDQTAAVAKVAMQMLQRYGSVEDIVRAMVEVGDTEDVQVNVPVYNDAGNIVDMLNDLTIGDFDVVRVNEPNLGTTRAAQAAMMNTFLTQNKIPPTGSTMKMMAELADLPQLDQVANELDQMQQLQGTVGQLEEAVKQLSNEKKRLLDQLVKGDKQLKVKDFEVMLDKIINKISAEAQIESASLKQEANQILKEMEMEAQKTSESAQAETATTA